MTRLAVKIAYIGEGLSGSQMQPGLDTVESEVLRDISIVTGQDRGGCGLRFSSRTDKGVGALGNVVAVTTDMEPQTYLKALNAVSERVFYRSWCEVDEGFNPRHANRRVYRYIMPSTNLDLNLARECADVFTGTHDFASFCRYDGKDTVLTVDSIKVDEQDGALVLEFTARYFLWNMIRRISSAVQRVASGREELDTVVSSLDGNGNKTFGIAPAEGLTLVDVQYDALRFDASGSEGYATRLSDQRFSSELRRRFLDDLRSSRRLHIVINNKCRLNPQPKGDTYGRNTL
ncbi:MAG: tRNA pseudouridine(38-40) synthase TruA [Candidatus Methanomethylophilaceae archaeon]|nr:tRNA pseudouridine(38-40) synthase TruA [Candidatus Methanomethylophilaceae archaeon]